MSRYDVTDFQAEVVDRSREIPVLVDFWAEWCGPCKALGPVLEKLAAEAGDRWELAKVDTEQHGDVAVECGIRSIPAVKLFVDGEVVNEFVGALPEEHLRRWLAEALPGPSAGRVRRARELLATGAADDAMRARDILEEILRGDADDEEARVLIAEALLFDDPGASIKRLEPVGAGARHGDRAAALRTLAGVLDPTRDAETFTGSPAGEAYRAAIEALARRDFDTALAGFIDVAGRDRALDDDGARNACVAIFTLLGDDAPETREHRRHLARVLFV